MLNNFIGESKERKKHLVLRTDVLRVEIEIQQKEQ